jgi:hypothetical protein
MTFQKHQLNLRRKKEGRIMATKKDKKMIFTILVLGAILLISAWVLVPATQAGAETRIGSSVDNRTIVALRVGQAELQSWLPAPWQVNPIAKGPLKEANLMILFGDRLLDQDAQGKPTAGETYRYVVLVSLAKHPQTGKSAMFIIRIYIPYDPELSNPFKNAVRATIRREYTFKGADLSPGTVSDLWELRHSAGGMLEFRIEYQRAVPRRVKEELRPHSSVEPDFFQIFRVDQGSDLIKSIPAGINRVQSYRLHVTVSELRKMFDGTEKIVGIVVVPWYVRKTFLP